MTSASIGARGSCSSNTNTPWYPSYFAMFDAVIPCSPRIRSKLAYPSSCGAPGFGRGGVHLDVPLRRCRPRMVLSHRTRSELPPRISIRLVPVEGAQDRVGERGRLVLDEGEAVALRIGVDVADGGRETTDRTHHRDRPVPKRDELSQTARLEPRWHQEEIRPRIDPLRQRRVETERQRKASLVLRGEVAPLLLVGRIAAAQNGELSACIAKPRCDGGQEVHALLLHETTDDPEDRGRGLDRQTRLLLEGRLADRFAVLVVRVVVRRDVWIVRRIEEFGVDAVGDAPEVGSLLPQESLQAL